LSESALGRGTSHDAPLILDDAPLILVEQWDAIDSLYCSLIIVLCCGGWNLRTKLVPPQTAEAERPAELRALVAFVFRLFFTVLLVPVVGCGCEPPTADLMTELKAGS
jgi:hypothetical protein